MGMTNTQFTDVATHDESLNMTDGCPCECHYHRTANDRPGCCNYNGGCSYFHHTPSRVEQNMASNARTIPCQVGNHHECSGYFYAWNLCECHCHAERKAKWVAERSAVIRRSKALAETERKALARYQANPR